MINTLYSEILKLKKSFFLLIILVGGLALPGLLFLGWAVQSQGVVIWNEYTYHSEFMMILVLSPVLFSLISSYVFSREFTDKTANILYCYPISRTKIFVCKLLIIYLIITVVYIIHFLGLFGGGLILKHELLTKEILLIHFKISLYSMILQFSLVPIVIFIASLSRNILVPVIYGILLVVSNFLLVASGKFKYSPFMMPGMPLINYNTKSNVDHYFLKSNTIIMAVIVFVISFIACIIYYKNTDIS